MTTYKKLAPDELSSMIRSMGPRRATRFYLKCMANPDTPPENAELLLQFYTKNQDLFLSPEKMSESFRSSGSWRAGGRGIRERGTVTDSDGYIHYSNGEVRDRYGNYLGGMNDGGSEYRGRRSDNGSGYYGPPKRQYGMFRSKPIDQPRSVEELTATMTSLKNNVARTRYFQKVVNNPKTPEKTKGNIMLLRESRPDLFASDDEAQAAGPQKTSRGRFSGFWKSDDEFKAMSPKKQMFFVKATQSNNHARNTAYGLRVVTNPETAKEDRRAMCEVVNENPGLFFKNKSGKRA